ncbi:guanine nucleotide-binding protein-like 3 [Ornithorhynchus anatinus]|uniref:Guanine nucleotide-binding protein-like 3 n=1 Tax=Ornithorhynchus anatinus TaxID=9258 RepID=F7FIF4_ORNAN|nr:guanine nucleotide-binding protein-like 3 [Ornithorhynchus anatinus]
MKRPKLKKASKRMSCHKRYKIQKKVREHKRKVRKEAKKRGHKKRKTDPGIPNSAPFKEALLREAEQRKQQLEELKQKQKLERQKEQAKKKLEAQNVSPPKEEPVKKEPVKPKEQPSNQPDNRNLKESFCRELKKVIEESDVVLEVLDARDPLGCRCSQVEQLIIQSGGNKKLLLVLNKTDLVPKENLRKWLWYLQKEFPTVIFKSSVQPKDKVNPSRKKQRDSKAGPINLSIGRVCVGGEGLLKLLQNFCETDNETLHVGVIGFPSVGKSSIINSLKKTSACQVGPARGITRSMQVVRVDKQIKMLDSPCLIASPSNSAAALALRSLINTGDEKSVLELMSAVLKHCSKKQIMLHYKIPDYRNSLEFLILLAQKRGMHKKGNVPDSPGIARVLLSEWTGAKLNYHSKPPRSFNFSPHLNEDIVAAMQQGFNRDQLAQYNANSIKAIHSPSKNSSIVFESSGLINGIIDENHISEEESEDDDDTSMEEEDQDSADEDIEVSFEPAQKPEKAKALLERPRSGEQLGAQREDSLNLDLLPEQDDAYDFNTDYV